MFKIPWTEQNIPHVMLEINQECNITCATCYKKFDGTSRPLDKIVADLDFMQSERRLQTVSIGGGEPTMHPQIVDIVREIHRRGLKSALVTNGVLVDQPLLRDLKAAGLDMVMFHIDSLQSRPDLPSRATPAELQALRDEKVEAAGAAGIDAGLSFMLSRGNVEQLVPLVDYVLGKQEISTLLVSHSTSVDWFVSTASLARHDRQAAGAAMKTNRRYSNRTTNDEVYKVMQEEFGLEPFGYLPSKDYDGEPLNKLQWVNYFIPVAYADGGYQLHRTSSGLGDLLTLKLYRALAGRYVFYTRQDRGLMLAQLVLNGLFSRKLLSTVKFLRTAGKRRAVLRGKRIAFDNGHNLTPDGDLVCMEHCPNPTVRDGKIVPVCMADHEVN